MIHTNRIVTVGEQECIIDRPIVLYRGDREVEIEFTLVGNEFTFSEEGNVIKSVNASHGQLVLNTPSGEHMFSELAECHEGKVVFVVTKEMIDEFVEMGFYSFQIRLYDSAEMKSRVTIPPVMNGFDIRNPIAAEDETNVVDQGIVDYARIFKDQSNEELPTFTWNGEYVKTEWAHHDVITENKMNKIEDAIYSINANVKESDVVMLNTLDQVKKDADKYVKEHMAEVEADVDEFERNLNTDVQQFKIDTNAAMTAHKNEVSEVVDGFGPQLTQNTNDINIFKTAYVNVLDFGAKGDGITDDTQAIKNAITYAQSHPSRTLYMPRTSAQYLINDTINFFRINVQCHGVIKVNFSGIGIIAGSASTISEYQTIYIYDVWHSKYIDGDISVRVQGSKRMKYIFGSMKKLQVYADGNISSISSVAYCQFDIIGGIDTLEILGENNLGWINENTFYKGRIGSIIIDGDYSHNKNTFIDTCVEGGSITINNGHCNRFMNIRSESFKALTLGESTHNNIIEFNYYSSAGGIGSPTVIDKGSRNIVTTPLDLLAQVEILNMDSYNCKLIEGVDVARIGECTDTTFSLISWQQFFIFELPIKKIKAIHAKNTSTNGGRFSFLVLDSNKEVILNRHLTGPGFNFNSETGVLSASANSKGLISVTIQGDLNETDATYLKIIATSGNAEGEVERVNIIALCNHEDAIDVARMKPRINYNKLLSTNE